MQLVTDSNYLRQGVTEWLPAWKAHGWRTADKQPVKNQDLWQRLERALGARTAIEWHWVKGHGGDPDNERADRARARSDAQAGARGPVAARLRAWPGSCWRLLSSAGLGASSISSVLTVPSSTTIA